MIVYINFNYSLHVSYIEFYVRLSSLLVLIFNVYLASIYFYFHLK